MNKPFRYFFFRKLSFADFCNNFQNRYGLSNENARKIYEDWLKSYDKRAMLFYQSQFDRHRTNIYRAFREYNEFIPEYEVEDALLYDWDERFYKSRFEDHYNDYSRLSDAYHENDLDRPGLINLSDVLKLILEENPRKPSTVEIDEFWFDTLTANDKNSIAEYRKMPYNTYLDTDHWKRIRAAMLLLLRARCQAEDCYNSGESWYGADWETDLHVHHLHYRNRGNERYADLTLLCKLHHERWHNNANGEHNVILVERDNTDSD